MDKSSVITLISYVSERDSIGQIIERESCRDIFCNIRSVSANEWFSGASIGMNPSVSVTVFAYDYAGEKECILDGQKYAIYRTYRRQDDDLELYLEAKVGVTYED